MYYLPACILFALSTLGVLMLGWRSQKRREYGDRIAKRDLRHRAPWAHEAGRTRARMIREDRGWGE